MLNLPRVHSQEDIIYCKCYPLPCLLILQEPLIKYFRYPSVPSVPVIQSSVITLCCTSGDSNEQHCSCSELSLLLLGCKCRIAFSTFLIPPSRINHSNAPDLEKGYKESTTLHTFAKGKDE